MPKSEITIEIKKDQPREWKRNKTFDGKPIYLLGEKASGLRIKGEVQNFYSIRDQCLADGVLFEDPNFPATNSSVMFSRAPDRDLVWKRPKEICDDPRFFVEGFCRHDVRQGELGDCWFLAAAANLTSTTDSKLFFRVIPNDQSFQKDYAGIFHFRFWQYGKWIDVVVDDRLPTYRGRLVYTHSSDENEFWTALLEKAYAKLYGSYEALRGGTASEAMKDFTGGLGEMYELDDPPTNFFTILHKAYERNSMMACSLECASNISEAKTPEGLIRGHAYSITKVQMMNISTPNKSGLIEMVRLRNPWGNDAEWSGPWSDQSPEWQFIPADEKLEIGLTFDKDGEFWMSYTDFVERFHRVEICNLSPDSLTEEEQNARRKKWEMSMFEGEWTPGVTAGGCRNSLETFWHNPQYVVKLEDPDEDDDEENCTVIVALMQKHRRSKVNMGMDYLIIGFAIYQLEDHDLVQKPQRLEFFKYKNPVAKSQQFINLREVSARFKLPPGHYLIVPSTFEPNEKGEFLIRVFSEAQNTMKENYDESKLGGMITPSIPDSAQLEDLQMSELEELFTEIAGNDMEVDWMELKSILDKSMKDVSSEGFSKEVCRSMVAMMDVDQSGKLGLEEFKTLLTDIGRWKAVFKLHDTEKMGRISSFKLRDALHTAGYHLNNRILSALAYRYGSCNGMINFDDFITCTVKIKTMIDIFKERDVDGTNMATFSMDEWVERTIYS